MIELLSASANDKEYAEVFKKVLIPIPLYSVQDHKTKWKTSQSLLQNSKTLVLELGKYKHTVINIIHKAKTLKFI